MSQELNYVRLLNAIAGGAAAFRSVTKLQPVGGPGDRIFPATYQGGVYAIETRTVSVNGSQNKIECALLNSVPAEANHAEEALLDAVRRGRIQLPLIEIDFSAANANFREPLPNLTSLEVPHRLADAILRDTLLPDGTHFWKSTYAAEWSAANPWNATPIYKLCPTALVFGMWGSPEKPGGLGAKFERAYVSEIVAVDIDPRPRRLGFRKDPLGASSAVAVKPKPEGGRYGGFEVVPSGTKGAVKPSELNHGNILIDSPSGGIRCSYAEQTTVVSLGALRKLRFPVDGRNDPAIDDAARAVLAAIGLCAAVLAAERGTSLRSRCHLWPVEERKWELLDRPGRDPEVFQLNGDQTTGLLRSAVQAAGDAGLSWTTEKLVLQPAPSVVNLVRDSQEAKAAKGGDEE